MISMILFVPLNYKFLGMCRVPKLFTARLISLETPAVMHFLLHFRDVFSCVVMLLHSRTHFYFHEGVYLYGVIANLTTPNVEWLVGVFILISLSRVSCLFKCIIMALHNFDHQKTGH